MQKCKKAVSQHLYLKDAARAAGNSWRLAEGIAAASFAPKHAWQKTPTKSRPLVGNSRASDWNLLNCWPLFSLFFLPTSPTDWQVKGLLDEEGARIERGYRGAAAPAARETAAVAWRAAWMQFISFLHFYRCMPGMIHLPGHDDRMCECQEGGLIHLDLTLKISMAIALKGGPSPTQLLSLLWRFVMTWLALAYKQQFFKKPK